MKSKTIVALGLAAAFTAGMAVPAIGGALWQNPSSEDPFSRPVTPKKDPVKSTKSDEPVPIPFPSIDQRMAEYRANVDRAKRQGLPVPDPIGQYLVTELNVIGIFEANGTVGAFIQAAPTDSTFFVPEGARVYNGKIVNIREGSSFENGKVEFVEVTRFRQKKKEFTRENTVVKPVASPTR